MRVCGNRQVSLIFFRGDCIRRLLNLLLPLSEVEGGNRTLGKKKNSEKSRCSESFLPNIERSQKSTDVAGSYLSLSPVKSFEIRLSRRRRICFPLLLALSQKLRSVYNAAS